MSLDALMEANPELVKGIRDAAIAAVEERSNGANGEGSGGGEVTNDNDDNNEDQDTEQEPKMWPVSSASIPRATVALKSLPNTGDTRHPVAVEAARLYLTACLNGFKNDSILETLKLEGGMSEVTPHGAADAGELTTESVKVRRESSWWPLYGGLPFVCEGLGRRFRTLEDKAAFLRGVGEAKGWEGGWCGEGWELAEELEAREAKVKEDEEEVKEERTTFPADESRPNCRICGLPFVSYYDDEEGAFMFQDCVEVAVEEEDEAVEEEKVLVMASKLAKIGESLKRNHLID